MIIGVENNILPTISQPDLDDRKGNPVIDVMSRVLIGNALKRGTIPDHDTPLLQSGIKPSNVYTSSPEFANQVISGRSFQKTQVETKKGILGRTKTITKTTTTHLDLEERTQRFIDALPEVDISNKAENSFPGFVDRLLNTTSYGVIELFNSDGSLNRDGSDLVFEALINYTGETADVLGPNYTDALTLLSEAFETFSQEFMDGNSANTPRELVELILEGKIALNLLLTNHLAYPNASLDEVAQNALDIRDSVKDISAPDLALLEREAHKFTSFQTSVLVPTELANSKRVRLGDNLGEISVKDLHEIASGDISSSDIRRRLSNLTKEYGKIEGKTMTPIELQRIAKETLNRVYKDEQVQIERGEDVETSLSMITALPDSDEVTAQFLENIALKLDRLTPEQKKKLELGLNLTRFSVLVLTSIVGIGIIDALNNTPDNLDGETHDGWSHYRDEISLHDSNIQPTHKDHDTDNHLASVSIEEITKGEASDDLNVTVDIDNNDITAQEEIEPMVMHACFVAGTKVSTDEGEINIEQLAKGDDVISWDIEQERKLTTTVIKSFSRKVEMYFKVLIDNIVLEVTGEHPIYIMDKGFVKVSELEKEDEVQFITVSDTKKRIKKIDKINEPVIVYNIEVDEPHNYFANGVLVHNKMSANLDLDIPIEDNNGSDLVEKHSTEESTPEVDIAYPGDDLTENQMERFQRTGENYYEIKYGETISHAFVADGLDNQDIYGYDGHSGVWSELKEHAVAIHTDSDGHTSGYILVYDDPKTTEQFYNVINPDPQIDGTPAGSRLVVLNLPDGYNPINTSELIEDVLIPFQSVMSANTISFADNPEEGFLDLVHTAEYLINETISQVTVPPIVVIEETASILPPDESDLFALYINDLDFDGDVPKNFFQTVLDTPGNIVVVHREITGNGAFVAAVDSDGNGTYDSITVLEFDNPEEEAKLGLAFIPAKEIIEKVEEETFESELPPVIFDFIDKSYFEDDFSKGTFETLLDEPGNLVVQYKEPDGSGNFIVVNDTNADGEMDSITKIVFYSEEEEKMLLSSLFPQTPVVIERELPVPEIVTDPIFLTGIDDPLFAENYGQTIAARLSGPNPWIITEEGFGFIDSSEDGLPDYMIDFHTENGIFQDSISTRELKPQVEENVFDTIDDLPFDMKNFVILNMVEKKVDDLPPPLIIQPDSMILSESSILEETVEELVEEVVPEIDTDEIIDDVVEEVIPDLETDEVTLTLPSVPEYQNFYERFIRWTNENTNTVTLGLGIVLTSIIGLSFAEKVRRKGWPDVLPTREEIKRTINSLLGRDNSRMGEIVINGTREGEESVLRIVMSQQQIDSGQYGYIQVSGDQATMRLLPFVEGESYKLGDTEVTYPNPSLDALFMMGAITIIGREIHLTETGRIFFGESSDQILDNILQNSNNMTSMFNSA